MHLPYLAYLSHALLCLPNRSMKSYHRVLLEHKVVISFSALVLRNYSRVTANSVASIDIGSE